MFFLLGPAYMIVNYCCSGWSEISDTGILVLVSGHIQVQSENKLLSSKIRSLFYLLLLKGNGLDSMSIALERNIKRINISKAVCFVISIII